MQLEIAKIRRDGGTQPRAKLSEDTVNDYLEDMRTGDVFRPVTVFFDGADYWLSDGFHRVEAKLRLDPQGTIEADVAQGTREDAQWHSYSVNKTHGLRRTNEDKRRAVRAAISHARAHGLSNGQVAEHCGVDEKTIRKYRRTVELTSENPESDRGGPSTAAEIQNSRATDSTVAATSNVSDETDTAGEPSCRRTVAFDIQRPRSGRDGRTINTAKIGDKQRRKALKPRSASELLDAKRQGRHTRMEPLVKLRLPNNHVHNCAYDLLEHFTFEYLQKVFEEIVRIHQDRSLQEVSS